MAGLKITRRVRTELPASDVEKMLLAEPVREAGTVSRETLPEPTVCRHCGQSYITPCDDEESKICANAFQAQIAAMPKKPVTA